MTVSQARVFQNWFGLFVLVTVLLCGTRASLAETKTPSVASTYKDVVREAAPGLPGYTVYRPLDLGGGANARFPVVAWSNGGCAESNDSHLYFLTQVAAHGFVIVAHGAPDVHTSPGGIAQDDRLVKAIDWAFSPPTNGGPTYFDRLDSRKVATAGHSCGGIDAIRAGTRDERVTSIISLNSSCYPDNSDGGRSGPLAVCRSDLDRLGGPVLFVTGGPTDIAHDNSVANFNLVAEVPAALASHESAGHSGFFGSAPRHVQLEAVAAVVNWLDATLNGNAESLSYFSGSDPRLGQVDGWTVESSGF
jgi:hypothetical protein